MTVFKPQNRRCITDLGLEVPVDNIVIPQHLQSRSCEKKKKYISIYIQGEEKPRKKQLIRRYLIGA